MIADLERGDTIPDSRGLNAEIDPEFSLAVLEPHFYLQLLLLL